MKVLNIHSRILEQPKEQISELLATLATDNDMLLAHEKWSPMILDNGLAVGSKGGHGPIGYSIKEYIEGSLVVFEFSKPKGFIGTHRFEINEKGNSQTELKHCIEMNIRGMALLTWPLAIRWLHDAFTEDAFDKVENHFAVERKKTEWSPWVKFLRKVMKPKNK